MKRLIFDVDNTLIIWKEEYIKALEKAAEKHNLNIDIKLVDNIIENLEKKYEQISKEILLQEINDKCRLNLTMDFIDTLFENQGLLAEKDEKLIETIQYLSKKYSLVVLSNYFKEIQEKRLETAGIREYFEEIHGGDTTVLKPRKEAFLKAMGNYKKEDCIMIGDSITYDIKGAQDIGMKAIAVDHFDKIKEPTEYIVVKKLEKLKEIL